MATYRVMSVDSIRGVVEAAIQRASSATGVDFSFLLGTARRESGYNPGARAPTSSAAGLFQFVDQTWLSTLKKHGAKYGYARYADLIQQGPDGRYYVQGAEARRAVMDLRLDPHAASLMAGELASDHASYLRGRMGRDPTAGELYAAHVLGPQGSAKLIEAVRTSPQAPAAALFPEAAGAEPLDLLSRRAGRHGRRGLRQPHRAAQRRPAARWRRRRPRPPPGRLRPVRHRPPDRPHRAGAGAGRHGAARARSAGPDRRSAA